MSQIIVYYTLQDCRGAKKSLEILRPVLNFQYIKWKPGDSSLVKILRKTQAEIKQRVSDGGSRGRFMNSRLF